jgi:hypothetical protein
MLLGQCSDVGAMIKLLLISSSWQSQKSADSVADGNAEQQNARESRCAVRVAG